MRRGIATLFASLLVACLCGVASAQYDEGQGGESGASPEAAATPAAKLSPEDLEKQRRLDALNEERKKLQRKMVLRSRTGRLLNAAATELEQENSQAALDILAGLAPERLNPFERARLFVVRAQAHYQNGDPAASTEDFQRAVDEKALQVPFEAGLRFNVAQLLAAQQKWPEVIDAIHEWQEYTIEKKPIAHYLLAVAHYQAEDPDKALEEAEIAVELSDDPKEGWLTLLAALYVSKEMFDEAIPVFEELVTHHPKKQYWVQLSLLWGARENFRHALAVQQIAYEQGLLDEQKELERLARSYLFHELPYPAARVLEKGFEDGVIEREVETLELLANSWIAAREYEKSMGPLTEAAEMAEDGNLLVRLGQVHMQREEWNGAAELLARAIERGGLDNPGNAQLLLGISYYNDSQPERAKSSFAQAAQHERVREAAEGWIVHIDREAAAAGGTETTGG